MEHALLLQWHFNDTFIVTSKLSDIPFRQKYNYENKFNFVIVLETVLLIGEIQKQLHHCN